MQKCNLLGINVEEPVVQQRIEILHCQKGSFPFTYLGLTVGANMNHIRHWQPVIDSFENRLSLWKAKHLSMGGRIVLLNSVLNSLPTYFFSIYKAPITVIERLDKIRRAFLWEGAEKHTKIHWDKVVKPKKQGGLGIGSLRDINVCLLAKWWWCFKAEPNSLWRRVIHEIHNKTTVGDIIPSKPITTGTWNNIVKIDGALHGRGVNLKILFKGEVGNGHSLKFWTDLWIEEIPLCFKFKQLFKVERTKDCKIKDRIQASDESQVLTWEWSCDPVEGQEKDELEAITGLLGSQILTNRMDTWAWLGSKDKLFSVKFLKDRFSHDTREGFILQWSKWVPTKANILVWRAEMDRLPTRMALRRRNMQISSPTCPICNQEEETSEHLLIACPFANSVWRFISQWCKLPPIYAF
ncbi:hypothetical protein E3N88_39046 [Mikania micrantha]|uniref:Reverse transcriptase zinc-binding domain-containing protein n=1 Tax=Mikania micrantha TaxID=192012 RepID=A0A5N6LVP1_9ASTR|nr:hypothetical protein E3N88_39046 [Mikania micrantha]